MRDNREPDAIPDAKKDRDEQMALVAKILATSAFTRANHLCKILAYLAAHTDRYVSRNELAIDALGATAEQTQLSVASNVGERCNALRVALDDYAQGPGAKESWRCELPDGIRGLGYKLDFVRIQPQSSSTALFWHPHLEAADRVIIVTNSHLFYYDPASGGVFRFYDTNSEGEPDEALALLRKTHPQAYKKDLQLSRFYFSSGEVNAYEMLQKWFHAYTGLLIPRRVSRDVHPHEILDSSPILLGRPDANKFIRRILNSPEAAHLGYRFHKPLGAVKITSPTQEEIRALSRFHLTPNGVLGPVPNWEVVFGIATRLRNPSGDGSVTIISADYYSTVIRQIAAALTNDNSARQLLTQMNWPKDKPLPDSFELLFAVKLSPGNMEGEGKAELLAWRVPATAGLAMSAGRTD